MVKRPLPAFSLPMESLHNAVVVGSRTFLLFLLVSSFVKASMADYSPCRYSYGVWGVMPSVASTRTGMHISSASTTTGRFGLPPKISALSVRGGESFSEEDKLLEEEDEVHPDEDEIVEIEVNELDEEERLMEELEEVPSEADGGVDDWAGDEDDGDVNAELVEEMNEVTAEFDEDEDEDDLNTQDGQDVAAKGFEEEADNVSGEPEKTWETPESSFSREAAIPDHAIDDGDSSAFVDRMELADAYDEGETTSGGFEVENDGDGSGSAAVAPGGSSGEQEEAQESTSSAVAEQQASGRPPPTEIDAATKDILMKELNYRRSEVEKMRPDVAKIAADKRLRRPTEGVPVNWYLAGKVSNGNGLLKVLPKILLPVIVGALAVATGMSFDLTSPSSALPSKPPQSSRSEENKVSTSTKDAKEADDDEVSTSTKDAKEADDNDTKATEAESEPDVLPDNEHVNTPNQVHAHSIKPGRPPADVLDVTWLDKGITAVERRIKAFLGWEL